MINFDTNLIGSKWNIQKSSSFQYSAISAQYTVSTGDTVELSGNIPSVESITKLLQDRINSQIEARFPNSGGISLDGATMSMDWSPEAVSDRIVAFATSFMGAYQTDNPDLSGEGLVDGFGNLMRNAIIEGFNQAKEILGALSALSGDVADTVNQTYELTMQKLDAFLAGQKEQIGVA